jgi:hypothetical protein
MNPVGKDDAELPYRLVFGIGDGIDLAVGLDRREQKDAVVPDDWRRAAFAGDFGFPADVLGIAPLCGRIALRSWCQLARVAGSWAKPEVENAKMKKASDEPSRMGDSLRGSVEVWRDS